MTNTYNTDTIFALTSAIREQANNLIVATLEHHKITDILPAHGAVLNALFKNGSMTMSDLALAIDRKKSTITSMIKTLEDRGYCRRATDEHDARVQWIHLTEKGESMRTIQESVSKELLQKAWMGVPVTDQKECVRILRQILENLHNHESSAYRCVLNQSRMDCVTEEHE